MDVVKFQLGHYMLYQYLIPLPHAFIALTFLAIIVIITHAQLLNSC